MIQLQVDDNETPNVTINVPFQSHHLIEMELEIESSLSKRIESPSNRLFHHIIINNVI